MIIAAFGAFASGRPGLALWVPMLPFYYLMGPIAVYKALYELLYDPYFWDKTSHGVHPPDTDAQHHLGPSDNPAFTGPEPPPRPQQTVQPDRAAAQLGEAQTAQSQSAQPQSAQAKEGRSQTAKTASAKKRRDNTEQV